MTQTPTPRTDAEEGAIFAAFSEDRISAKQAIRAMAAESRRHEREAACRPSPVVISEMETPTPEMDAFERDTIACIPEDLHQLQAYARKGRELETRLAAAEAEIVAMREAP